MWDLNTANFWIIVIAWILILVVASLKRDKNLVTVIGILGTFIGIILGLLSFDTANIEGSISGLLNGLKTAFVTSIFGLAAALVLGLMEKKDESKDESDYLIEIRDEIKKLKSSEASGGKNVNQEILQELRQLNKSNESLQSSFDNFSKEMSESNVKVLVDAMEKVMHDFNANINSQLGQSFKELGQGVEALVEWQKQYKEQIELSTQSLTQSKDSLEHSSQLFEVVAQNAQNFSSVSQKLGKQMEQLDTSLWQLTSGANEFSTMAQSIQKMSAKMIESIDSLSHTFVQKADRIIGESEKQVTLMSNTFATQSSDLVETHQTILTRMKKEIDANNKNMSDQFLRIWVRLEQQVQNLDEQLGRELEKSLNSLGQQLTALSQKFVTDYGELAEKLEQLSKK